MNASHQLEHLTAPMARTLIADDQPDVAAALHLLLKGAGYQTEAVTTPVAALEAIKQRDFDIVLMDLNYALDTTSGQEGLALITNIRELDDTLPIVVLTGWGTVDLAVEAMQRGVHDFVQKPWDNCRLLNVLRTQIEAGRRQRKQNALNGKRELANKLLEQELAEAREIQLALLPTVLPMLQGVEVATAWKPAYTVGGDYFDLLEFDSRHSGICIADVAGKGMSAALLMSNVQAVLKSLASHTLEPANLCALVNRLVCENIVSNRFISCFYALLDTKQKKLSYTNAGHYPPILFRDGHCMHLSEGGPVLGVLSGASYEQRKIQLHRGDYLLLFTDGVTEARSAIDTEFGEERLQEFLLACADMGVVEMRDKILSELTDFTGGVFGDDVTLIVIRIN